MELECVYPKDPSEASLYEKRRSLRHVIFTAETHNFPTGLEKLNKYSFFLLYVALITLNNLQLLSTQSAGVAPFSGATTGTGGRIRDVQSAGRGGHVIAGTAGYCFGNLHIPGQNRCDDKRGFFTFLTYTAINSNKDQLDNTDILIIIQFRFLENIGNTCTVWSNRKEGKTSRSGIFYHHLFIFICILMKRHK